MVRLEFDIPDYAGGLALGPGGGLGRRIALALASAHARAVEGEAKRRAPVRTGRLRNSIRAYLAGAGRGVLEATAPYAKHLHEGTGIYGPSRKPIVIEPRGKKALWWPGGGAPGKGSPSGGNQAQGLPEACRAAALRLPAGARGGAERSRRAPRDEPLCECQRQSF